MVQSQEGIFESDNNPTTCDNRNYVFNMLILNHLSNELINGTKF